MSARELWLKDALSELMGVDVARISATQTFAEQGVDSLIGLRLTRKLEESLGIEVDLEWLFDHPSIHELAQFLDAHFGVLDAESVRLNPDRRIDA